ncbi:hypothetical protein BRD10_04225 [Halobacteriales archaeon SW_12_71_31]|nr:MAG: hypothetical protein BRD10_04225 [Halobacteriales archaeon SW_12_71_31]
MPGESVWIAEASLDDRLRVERCRSARTAFGASGRENVLAALVDHVDDRSVVGVDCPFGLPRPVVEALDGPTTWRETVRWVGETFVDADEFAGRCKAATRAATDGERTYLRRATDGPVGAKSPYHFFTHRQAFHGVRDVLAPLLDRGAGVAPMTGEPADGKPTVVEVYPAGTLRRLGLPDESYKTASSEARRTRERILAGLEAEGSVDTGADTDDSGGAGGRPVTVADGRTRERVLADDGGDALDAVVAAVAAARAFDRDFAVDDGRYDPLEGYVYV